MRRERELENLIECWTLNEADLGLIANKPGATRLGFALAVKFFEQEARFPRHAGELPPAAVKFVAAQVKVDPAMFAGTRGRVGRPSITRRSSGPCWASASRWPAMRTSWRTGWPRRCAQPSRTGTGCD